MTTVSELKNACTVCLSQSKALRDHCIEKLAAPDCDNRLFWEGAKAALTITIEQLEAMLEGVEE